MKFSSREDIEAPIQQVFDMLCEFEYYERSAIRRGIEVRRMDDRVHPGTGMAWAVRFKIRGHQRDMELKLSEYDAPVLMRIRGHTTGLDSDFILDLMALSPQRTRLAVSLDLKPSTLSARLLIQSLKLAKTRLSKRFKQKVAEFAQTLEDRQSRI